MEGTWKIIYYEDEKGECPIEDFFNSTSDKNRAKIFNWLGQLEEHGPTLPRPFADLLEDGIHELRIKLSGNQVRILYFFCYREFIILTHAFVKHSDRAPNTEIARAKKYRGDFLHRNSDNKIRGH